MLVVLALLSVAAAADGNGNGCQDALEANGACVDNAATVDASASVGAGAAIGPGVDILANVTIAPKVDLAGSPAETSPQTVGVGTTLGRRTTLGPDTTLGAGNVFARAVTGGARLLTEDSVTVGYGVTLGDDVTLRSGARVANLADLGDGTELGVGASVGRGATLTGAVAVQGGARVGPGVQVTGPATLQTDARVRRGATIAAGADIGASAVVGRGVTVGANTVIGAGARIGAGATLLANASVGDGVVVPRGATVQPSTIGIVDNGGVREWADGTYATACHSYRTPTSPYAYTGATGDGAYRVDPDGPGGVAPFDVYCDMTTDNGGWTLVDNDATNAATFTSRVPGAISDITVTGGRLLPAYDWSSDPLLLCKSSIGNANPPWVTLEAGGAIAREYPTTVSQTASHDGGWAVRTLNGATNQGVISWIFNGAGRFGSVWIGYGQNATCACDYTGVNSGLGTYGPANQSTCSTWVR